MELNTEELKILNGEKGRGCQMAMSLLVDLGEAAKASRMISIKSAHVSGVSPLTGGFGLIKFLEDITKDEECKVSVSTTLNAAGCDEDRINEMDIPYENYLEKQKEILECYEKLGIEMTMSCTPYEVEQQIEKGNVAWAESNAICYANSYTKLRTNRESGLSALASAICGVTPEYGLLLNANRVSNFCVEVLCDLETPTDYSILGDWIGKNIPPEWDMPYGPIPCICGIATDVDYYRRKALSAAAANYGSPMIHLNCSEENNISNCCEKKIVFSEKELKKRYSELAPKENVDLIVIGCPQASYEEIQETEKLLRSVEIPDNRLWVFTSRSNYERAYEEGIVESIEKSGAMILKNTCPEVVPYNREKVKHILTNSLKAEHYLTSGLNNIPTSVMRLKDCIEVAATPQKKIEENEKIVCDKIINNASKKKYEEDACKITGRGLKSQKEWDIEGVAMVTDIPITFLGYVNRETGKIEERGHPLNGETITDKILIFPKGSGSSVAPYVLMELFYRGKGPKAIVNSNLDQQMIPACSLLKIPYAHSFNDNPCYEINTNDKIRLELKNENVELEVLERASNF